MSDQIEVRADLKIQKLRNRLDLLEDENSTNYALAIEYKAKADKLEKELQEANAK